MPTVIEDLDFERKPLDLSLENYFDNFIMCYSQVYKYYISKCGINLEQNQIFV